MLIFPNVSAQTVTSLDFRCLTREQKEKIEICFEENEVCHAELATTATSAPSQESFWVLLIMTGAIGFVGGLAARGMVK